VLAQLVVRLGCGQPWCVTLFAALAAPPAHLIAVELGCFNLLCVRKHCSLVLQTKIFFDLPASSSLLPIAQPFRIYLQQLGSCRS
jgi:hypothetical protein